MSKLKQTTNSGIAFQTPFWSSALIGAAIASVFYLMLHYGPLHYELLRRYAMCHAVAVVSVYLFAIAMAAMVQKGWTASRQYRRLSGVRPVLDEILRTAPRESNLATASWLNTMLLAQAPVVAQSWLIRRLVDVVSRQTARGSCRHLEEDLRELADLDADRQHESYGLVRIISWAMPMFGFLGTVIGISETLGQMDTKSLASGSQEAMNSLTAGLYVAFDTTAVGLVLTMAAMFTMYAIGRLESSLLGEIDQLVSERLLSLLSESETKPQDVYRIEQTVRLVTDKFLGAVERIVETQANLWRDTISQAQSEWQSVVHLATDSSKKILVEALEVSLGQHARQLEQVQLEGASQIDARYQQWQLSLSEQARSMHACQSQIVRQTEVLSGLIEKGDQLRAIEDGLQQNLTRLTDIDRFHEAAICLTEAVAVLGTQMERAGYFQSQKLRRVAPPASDQPQRRAA